MVIAIIFSFLYSVGVTATMGHRMNDEIDHAFDNIASGRPETPSWVYVPLSLWIILCSMIWPLYWTGRALYAIPEQLALTPGEPQ